MKNLGASFAWAGNEPHKFGGNQATLGARDARCCRSGAVFCALVTLAFLINGGRFLSLSDIQRELLLQLTTSSSYSSTAGFLSGATRPEEAFYGDHRTPRTGLPAAATAPPEPLAAAANSSAQPVPGKKCDLAVGSWVPSTRPPLYTNESCKYIHPAQNCMKNGRPDQGYLSWKWKPHGCELPEFDPWLFLDLMKGKKMMFIGDSIARNHKQALLCALSQVEDPQNVYDDLREKESTWIFMSYNFTLGNIWSPFLVRHKFEEAVYNIYLDVPDTVWSRHLATYDVAIVSTGYWYFRPSVYYFNNTILGANPRAGLNLTTYSMLPALEFAWDSVLKYMVDNFQGIAILRTITVPHFDSGTWSTGGNCNKTEPLFDPKMEEPLPYMNSAIKKLQLEAFSRALNRLGAKHQALPHLKLLDVTYSALLRPDGHPGSYRIQRPGEPVNDCLHWCMPGPIDMWNQLVLHVLKNEHN